MSHRTCDIKARMKSILSHNDSALPNERTLRRRPRLSACTYVEDRAGSLDLGERSWFEHTITDSRIQGKIKRSPTYYFESKIGDRNQSVAVMQCYATSAGEPKPMDGRRHNHFNRRTQIQNQVSRQRRRNCVSYPQIADDNP